ncbi:hypothetical protein PPERSA_10386 [Pseudocohnilembus persalinus]|uniref:RING-type domain-containing protein n=1 Tax=Pseudocohnilembus persalinus TaxID=266149 RepID=A0A0V0R252_PSEPJ|nr:hypothetical protein PPERSA_10386 [Pseudocohnilembus persalinus]|eukprot:KRX08582.1 hypothetical protein PPERSA_10386 [Pseudocohnilembus persalinus]
MTIIQFDEQNLILQKSQFESKEQAAPCVENKPIEKGITLNFLMSCEKNQFDKYLEKFKQMFPFKCNLGWKKIHDNQNQEIHQGKLLFKKANEALEFVYQCNYSKIFKYHLKIQEKIPASKFLQFQQNHRFVIESVNNQAINFKKINKFAMKSGLVYTIDDCNNKNTMVEIIFYHKQGAINFMKNFKKIDEDFYLDSEKLQLENNDQMKVIKISDTIKKEFQINQEDENFLATIQLVDLSESQEIDESEKQSETEINFEQSSNNQDLQENQDIQENQENQEELEIQKELEELQNQKKCISCNNNDKGIIYQPCGHFLVCFDCEKVYSKCKVCQSDILKGNQIFIIKKNQQ